ncbi:MAG TPA: hypothetical protein VKX17_13400, partial [Planctomycetota bacterium]|nr:hypothetical protein [Planctomycetota bacterium]
MSKSYDTVGKFLLRSDAEAWLKWLGIRAKTASVCNVDLSTVSSAADALLMIEYEEREALHIELQTGHNPSIGAQML